MSKDVLIWKLLTRAIPLTVQSQSALMRINGSPSWLLCRIVDRRAPRVFLSRCVEPHTQKGRRTGTPGTVRTSRASRANSADVTMETPYHQPPQPTAAEQVPASMVPTTMTQYRQVRDPTLCLARSLMKPEGIMIASWKISAIPSVTGHKYSLIRAPHLVGETILRLTWHGRGCSEIRGLAFNHEQAPSLLHYYARLWQ